MLRSLILSLCLLSPMASADEPSADDPKLALAIELLAVIDMDQMFTAMQSQVESMITGQLQQLETCEAMKPAIEGYSKDMGALIGSKLTAEQFMPEIAQLYAEVFTQAELQGLLDFYRSPLGEKMLAKMPELMQRSMTIGQNQMTALMPEIEAAAERFGDEIEAARAQCEESE